MEWIRDSLPKSKKPIIFYDLFEGYFLGFFDEINLLFVSQDGDILRNVSAWLYLPEKPKDAKRVMDNVLFRREL